jgi:dihydroorotate dehydrogenase
MKYKVLGSLYKNIARPVFFKFDAEVVHGRACKLGESISNIAPLNKLMCATFSYKNPILQQTIKGVDFINPIGLAAGFDYDGYVSAVLPSVGFGYNTVGTVTAKPYQGNDTPRLARLVKSKSLLVNKGFKSQGAKAVAERLDSKSLSTIGISVGSTNIPQIDTVQKAIDDYVETFSVFKDKPYVSYFELNISCPNITFKDSFSNNLTLTELILAVNNLNIKQPIFIKMPNEISVDDASVLVETALRGGINGFIFSNLVKDRSNSAFDADEIAKVAHLKGNFSGRPTYSNSNALIRHIKGKFANDVFIIGCGGVFSAQDAYEKIKCGANLVQLITGLIYEGPFLPAQINYGLVDLLKKDGYTSISEAVGEYARSSA